MFVNLIRRLAFAVVWLGPASAGVYWLCECRGVAGSEAEARLPIGPATGPTARELVIYFGNPPDTIE